MFLKIHSDLIWNWRKNLIPLFWAEFTAFTLYSDFFCKRGDLKKIKTPVVWAVSLIGFVFTVFMIWISNKNGYDFHLWYDFPGIFLASMFAFEGLSRIKFESKPAKVAAPLITQISVVSLGMYFIHKPIINDISSLIMDLGFGRGLSLAILVAVPLCQA